MKKRGDMKQKKTPSRQQRKKVRRKMIKGLKAAYQSMEKGWQ